MPKMEKVYRGTIEYFADDRDLLQEIGVMLREPVSSRTDAGGDRMLTRRFYCDQTSWDALQAGGHLHGFDGKPRFTVRLD